MEVLNLTPLRLSVHLCDSASSRSCFFTYLLSATMQPGDFIRRAASRT
jgi:hypothetical protein